MSFTGGGMRALRHRVTVGKDPDGVYSAWCACAATSPRDPDHRGVGRGSNAVEAVEAWRNWQPD